MITVSVVAAILYKTLGVSNAEIGVYTGAMYLPWVLKPLWAPFLELVRTKRFFVITMEAVLAATFACLALALRLPGYFPLTIALFWIAGFASATQDIAGDGVYLSSTTEKEQAIYMGVQGTFWNLARVLVSGSLVSLTKWLYDGSVSRTGETGQAWFFAWMVVMLLIAGIMACTAIWHARFLPTGDAAAQEAKDFASAMKTLGHTWVSFFKKPRIWTMLLVVFLYRFGEGFIEKIGPLFLLDKRELGGLGLDTMALGWINGFFGTATYITGTLLGGALAARYSLRKTFLIIAIALNVPHVTYFYLSQALPTDMVWITIVVLIEKFGYGIGSVGLMLYMMQELAPGDFRTSHYAFGTGVMALNMLVTGMAGGILQSSLGYQGFFIFVLVASVPPILAAMVAPFRAREDAKVIP